MPKEKNKYETVLECYEQGMSCKEIVAKTGIASNVVSQYLWKIKKQQGEKKEPKVVNNTDRHLCKTCQYRSDRSHVNGCDYADITGHLRGCSVEECTKFIKGPRLRKGKENGD